jgi:argininosuccinate synthase
MKLKDLKGRKVGICVSGGLDSRTVTTRLLEAGVDVMCFTADLGQPDEKDINDVAKRMEACGAKCEIVDLREQMADACMRTIMAQATYADTGYWNTTGIARAVTVKGLLYRLHAYGCTVLAHGATGRGNDQMRFEYYTKVLYPSMAVYAPWRDPELLEQFPGRTQMVAYLRAHGIDAEMGVKKLYSTDANLAGLSNEADDLESLETPCTIVTPIMGVWPFDAPDKRETFSVTFDEGLVIGINEKRVTPLEAMEMANTIGGRNGIGLTHAVENRMLGTKSRGVYEAPGMELLGRCLRFLYQATMNREAQEQFDNLSRFLGKQFYYPHYFDPATVSAVKMVEDLASFATGTVEVELYKGNILFSALRNVRHSLYVEANASMEASDGLNPASSQGFAEILSIEATTLAKAGQIEEKW